MIDIIQNSTNSKKVTFLKCTEYGIVIKKS
jgi:hypothetical protein